MEQFTKEELQNIYLLIQKAPITGIESITVALLIQKITGLLKPKEENNSKPAKEGKDLPKDK